MKSRFSRTLILLVIFLAACAPVESAMSTNSPAATQPPTVSVPTATVNSPTLGSPTEMLAPTEAVAATPFPIATSRGPNLEATNPTTVSLASGGLQFVEFFRFT